VKKHILIVEDQREKYELVKNVIQNNHNVFITWAESISAAYNIVGSNPKVDLILLDMAFAAQSGLKNTNANGVAGLELLQHLRARLITTPVIVVTSYDSFTNGVGIHFPSVKALENYINKEFPKNYLGIVRTLHNTNSWHVQLNDLVGKSLNG